ncbi:Heme sensor protein HssS [compost metagenome]
MKSLYTRTSLIFCSAIVVSSLLAFLLSNLYYQIVVKPENDDKLTGMALQIQQFGQAHADEIDGYLASTAALGYKMLLTDGNGGDRFFGKPFRVNDLPQSSIEAVLKGEIYHGIAEFPGQLFVTGFFDNQLRNSIGVPLNLGGTTYALFMRADAEVQFGELRIFFAMIIVLTALFSLAFMLVTALHIVLPIIRMTDATRKISQGRYDITLNTRRKDEIGVLAEHFMVMSRELERTNRARQEFVANVSHEIESPLTSIQGFAHTLRTEEVTADQRSEYLTIIEEESRRMSRLSKQLLTLSSLDYDPGALEITRFSLKLQIRQIAQMLEWRLSEKQLALRLSVQDIDIRGDANLLYQVWMNLLSNAVKHTPEGGEIAVSAAVHGGRCRVTVYNSGEGLPPEELERIFDRFYKVDKNRSREDSGSGLGLAIVRKIVQAHQGTVEAASEIGKGTTFTVELPLADL